MGSPYKTKGFATHYRLLTAAVLASNWNQSMLSGGGVRAPVIIMRSNQRREHYTIIDLNQVHGPDFQTSIGSMNDYERKLKLRVCTACP